MIKMSRIKNFFRFPKPSLTIKVRQETEDCTALQPWGNSPVAEEIYAKKPKIIDMYKYLANHGMDIIVGLLDIAVTANIRPLAYPGIILKQILRLIKMLFL